MELLGTVEETTSDGKAVVRSEKLPEIGDPVFDRREKKVGNVKRIFGPVDEPYVSVQLDDKTAGMGLKNKPLYFTTRGTQNGKGKRRNRRN
ncbi:MAG: Gar1/Naf1 family protein [Candidatus Methanomethylophilaceae archaeon]|jgi:RNA-binding protein